MMLKVVRTARKWRAFGDLGKKRRDIQEGCGQVYEVVWLHLHI